MLNFKEIFNIFGPTPTGRIRTYKFALVSRFRPPDFLRNCALEFSEFFLHEFQL